MVAVLGKRLDARVILRGTSEWNIPTSEYVCDAFRVLNIIEENDRTKLSKVPPILGRHLVQ